MGSSRASEALQFDFVPGADAGAPEEDRTGAVGVAGQAGVRSSTELGPIELAPPPEEPPEAELAPPPPEEPPEAELDREPGASADEALTVAEFYDRVKYAMRMEFPADVWVTGEIRKVTVSKGNRYLELSDHHGPPGRAGGAILDVACWSRDWPIIGAELQSVGLELTAGLVVRIRGRVSIWEGGSRLRFSMIDLDVAALLGGIAAARRRLLVALEQEGLLRANRSLPPPMVPMKLGVVTSAGSEAYRDFTGQLERSGFAFNVRLETSLVQGPDAAGQLAAAIRRLHRFEPDLIVIVRGGGGKGDLAAFDSEHVARAVATSRFPIWTGIGHTGDESVADVVAQRALITPSACGEAVVLAVATYLESIDARAAVIGARCRFAVEKLESGLNESRGRLARAARHELDQADSALELARSRAVRGTLVGTERNRASLHRQSQDLGRIARHAVSNAGEHLMGRRAVLDALDPKRQLARGWSITRRADGRIARSVIDVTEGERLVTVLADGTVASIVDEVSAGPEETT